MDFLLKPRFRPQNNALFFETDRLNALQRARYNDKFGFYQRTFGVYSYMNLTNELTFRVHYIQGTPFVWQPHNNCAWTPTGTLTRDTMDITPCRVKLNEQHCYDEYFGSAYKAFNSWSPGGTIGPSASGIEANNALVETIMANATLGARMSLSGGQLHDLTSVTFKAGVSTTIEQAYRNTSNVCKGWIQLARTNAATDGLGHLNNDVIQAGDISSDGTTWLNSGGGGRDVTTVYDLMLNDSSTPSDLKDFIIEGGSVVQNSFMFPLLICSQSVHRGLYNEWLAQKQSAMMNEPRIEMRDYPAGDGKTMKKVMFIDETAVIPLAEVSQFDKYVTGTSHFMYLTVSGVIQLGSSFASLPVVNESDVAVMMQVSTDAEDYGTHKFLSHGLLATAINDTNYICGDYVYAEPA